MTPEAAETVRWVADRFALGRVRSMRWVARGATGEVHRLVTDIGAYAVKRAFWREDPDDVALGALATAYGAAGGVELPEVPELFASGAPVWLNFLAGQVGVLVDPDSEPEHREFAETKVRGLLDDLPGLTVLGRCRRVAGQAANRERSRRPLTMGP